MDLSLTNSILSAAKDLVAYNVRQHYALTLPILMFRFAQHGNTRKRGSLGSLRKYLRRKTGFF
jgi:hypothetical protein